MADGQHAFGFRELPVSQLRAGEIIVDLFAGGGGASTALRQALGRDPDIAINHDAWAVGMHAANHPFARHLCEDVWAADPRIECDGRAVGWLHASPDCTHFSQAKGGQPRSRATRALSWVVLKWAGAVRPRIISLENVEQIQKWGPLIAKRDRDTGRVVTLDLVQDPATGRHVNRVADAGEYIPLGNQYLIPDKRREGRTWRHFIAALRAQGYTVEWRKLRACDFGAGTSRTRLFLIARCDGEPIRWPEPTHGAGRTSFVTAADCIDFSQPCPSIFSRKKPLADATCRRIARGIKRYVLDAAEPFIAPTITTGDHHALVTAFLEQANTGVVGHDAREPLSTLTGRCTQQRVVTAHMAKLRGTSHAADVSAPLGTISAGGEHHALIECTLSPEAEAGALRVAAFLIRYYGEGGQWGDLRDPLDTITTRDRLALVTVHLRGVPYVIVDIGLRMLRPPELYRAQGFPPEYVIDRTADGRAINNTRAVRMVGNSVSPPPLAALARANLDAIQIPQRIAA